MSTALAPSETRPIRVLVIDENAADVERVEGLLGLDRVGDFEVESAHRLSSGLRKLERGEGADAVLLNLGLPDSSGYETFLRLQARAPGTPVIILSDRADEELASKAVREGAQDYLIKGRFDHHEVAHAVRYAIERQRAEARLEASEVRYRRLFETTQDGVLLMYADTGKVTDANPFLTKLLGRPREAFVGGKLWELEPFAGQEIALREAFELLRDRPYVRYEDLALRAARGQTVHVEFVAHAYRSGQNRLVQCNLHDITARRLTEASLHEAFERLSAEYEKQSARLARVSAELARDFHERRKEKDALDVSKRMVRAQEEERRWIARELHDSVNQILSSAKFRIQDIEGRMPGKDPMSAQIGKARELLDLAIQEVRRISQNLRPTVIGDLGLIPALRNLADDFIEHAGMDLRLRYRHFPKQIATDVALALYRIAQEALNNISKHSGATRVLVRLSGSGHFIQLAVKDNGKGFDLGILRSPVPRGNGLGLTHIRERAEFLGGTMTVRSTPKRGTEIIVRIPFERRSSDR